MAERTKAERRLLPVTRAAIELADALHETRRRHGLTTAEVLWILAEAQRQVLMIALYQERRDDDEDDDEIALVPPEEPPRPACPACGGPTVERGAAVWCDRCRRKIETCCDGGDMRTEGRPGA